MLYCANFPRSFLRLKVPFALFNRFWILLFISPSLFITLPKEVKDFRRLDFLIVSRNRWWIGHIHRESWLQFPSGWSWGPLYSHTCWAVWLCSTSDHACARTWLRYQHKVHIFKRAEKGQPYSICFSLLPVSWPSRWSNWKERRTHTRLSHIGLNLIKLLHFKKDITWKKIPWRNFDISFISVQQMDIYIRV